MRYLYHLTEGNRGPVTFEQLQELAKAGTIDNMTPILAEGAREWSRWLFIKDTPRTSSPAPAAEQPAPAAKQAPAPKPKKEEKKPETKPAPAPAEKKPAATEETKQEATTPAEPSKPVEAPKPAAEEAKAEPKPSAQAPLTAQPADSDTVTEVPTAPPFSLSGFVSELKFKQLIPAGVSALVTLLSLLAACVWTLMAHDTEKEYAQLQDMATEHEQSRQSLDNLSASRQQVQAETLKLNEDYRRMQETLKLTQEESGRLAKGPYISEAEAKQLKDEQAKAARLKEQEQKL